MGRDDLFSPRDAITVHQECDVPGGVTLSWGRPSSFRGQKGWLLPGVCAAGLPLPKAVSMNESTHGGQAAPSLSACRLSPTLTSCSRGGPTQESPRPNCKKCRGESRENKKQKDGMYSTIIAKKWKQCQCPSADEWVNETRCLHLMGSPSAIKRNEISARYTRMTLETMPRERSQTQRPCIVWSQLRDTSRISKSMETESS